MSKFILIFLALFCSANAYLIVRTWQGLAGTGSIRQAILVVMLLLAASFPAGRLLEGSFPQAASLATTVGSYYIAQMMYGFIFMLLADIIVFLILRWEILPPSAQMTKVIIVFAATLLVSAGGYINALFPKITHVSATFHRDKTSDSTKLPGKIKIAMASDIHYGRVIQTSRLRRIADLLMSTEADIIFFVGDTIDDVDWLADQERVAKTREIFESLHAPLGVWAVMGNHEHYADARACEDALRSFGVNVLRDDWAVAGEKMLIAGREDRILPMGRSMTRKSLDELIPTSVREEYLVRKALPLIVLDHQPSELHEAESAGAAMQLSGHTHNGQLFPFNFIVDRIYECAFGYHKRGDTEYYISCGAGTWGPPFRTSSRSEIAVIDLDIYDE